MTNPTTSPVCTGPGHPVERLFEPRREAREAQQARGAREAAESAAVASTLTYRDSIAADLGLYDDLIDCIVEGEWADTGVVEHRYGTANPDKYRWMVDRWGHTAMGPRKYSVTSFIGGTLGDLTRTTDLTYRTGRGTGFFDYNPHIGLWTLEPVSGDAAEMTWARFAAESGFPPEDWPLLGYEHDASG